MTIFLKGDPKFNEAIKRLRYYNNGVQKVKYTVIQKRDTLVLRINTDDAIIYENLLNFFKIKRNIKEFPY